MIFLIYLCAHRDQASILSSRGWRTLHTPAFGGDYALGWIVRRDGSLWHSGSTVNCYAEASFDSNRGFAVAAVPTVATCFRVHQW